VLKVEKVWESEIKCAKSWESMRKCAKTWESVLKFEKVWESVLKVEKVWESVSWNLRKYVKVSLNLRKLEKVCVFVVNANYFLMWSTKVWWHFLGGGWWGVCVCRSLSEDSMLLSKNTIEWPPMVWGQMQSDRPHFGIVDFSNLHTRTSKTVSYTYELFISNHR